MHISLRSALAHSALLMSLPMLSQCAPTPAAAAAAATGGEDIIDAALENIRSSIAHDSRASLASVPLRIMPLGASITFGQASTDGNGYRKALRDALVRSGSTVNMVGSRRNGTMRDNDVEGWPGFVIDQVRDKARAAVPPSLPNVFLVNAGTNDAIQDRDVAGAGARMEAMLADLWTMSPGSTVVLSTLLINLKDATEQRVQAVNKQFADLARRLQAGGKKIVAVDMHGPAGPLKSDMHDDTHPNDAGYVKMAGVWMGGIREATMRGFISKPADNGIPDDGGNDP